MQENLRQCADKVMLISFPNNGIRIVFNSFPTLGDFKRPPQKRENNCPSEVVFFLVNH